MIDDDERLGIVVNFFDGQSRDDVSELLVASTALSLRLLKMNPDVQEVLLVDGSAEPSEAMRRECERLNAGYLHGGRKLNYVEAYNLGWQTLDTPYIGLMANDIIPHPLHTMGFLKGWIQKPDIGCAFPYMHSNHTEFIEVQRPTFYHRASITCEPASMTLNLNLFKRQLLVDMGGLDPNYVVGFQEPILLIRIREMGYRCVLVAHTRVMHYDQLTKTMEASETSPELYEKDAERWFQEYPEWASRNGIAFLRFYRPPFSTTLIHKVIWWLAYIVPTQRLKLRLAEFVMSIEPWLCRYPARRGIKE